MKRVYTTLFDSTYLARGLVMIESLLRHSQYRLAQPEIHVLCMDKECYEKLSRLDTASAYPLEIYEIGEEELELQRDRTWQEFCWMMASVFTHTVMTGGRHPAITYLDADLMFFSDPEQIHDEIDERSIAIVPHGFHPQDEPNYIANGIYNVSWVSFAGPIGLSCLTRWKDQCIEWCYYRNEDGKFGDQKYLDAWPELYGKDLAVLDVARSGVAPWNLRNYPSLVRPYNFSDLIFYHYSGFKERPGQNRQYTLAGPGWRINDDIKQQIYQPYIRAYERAKRIIKAL